MATWLRGFRDDDHGTSLLEVVVGMALMAVFMTMFTGAIFLMTSDTNKTEALVSSEAQANQAYLYLDKTLRYASAITAPGQSTSGNWYVEFSVPASDGAATCYQLRIDTTANQLQQRTWAVTATGAGGTPTGWRPLASTVTNGTAAAGSATVPFVRATIASSQNQQLQVYVIAAQSAAGTANATTKVTFTALNSISDYGKSAPVACTQQGVRP